MARSGSGSDPYRLPEFNLTRAFALPRSAMPLRAFIANFTSDQI